MSIFAEKPSPSQASLLLSFSLLFHHRGLTHGGPSYKIQQEIDRRTRQAHLLTASYFAPTYTYTSWYTAIHEIIATRSSEPPEEPSSFTTNEEDQAKAAQLQSRLQENKRHPKNQHSSTTQQQQQLPCVEICSGAHKYVQIQASCLNNNEDQIFVVSRKGAAYHRNAAEPFIYKLEQAGYYDISVNGGGRIFLDQEHQKISIFGFSYGFGKANHQVSATVIKEDERYKEYEVSWSDDGY
jgi:phosphohistidine phosphatase